MVAAAFRSIFPPTRDEIHARWDDGCHERGVQGQPVSRRRARPVGGDPAGDEPDDWQTLPS